MFGFISNTISALKSSVKRAASTLLMNAVRNDRRWAIKPLLWLGADCNATYKTYNNHNNQNGIDYHETTLSYAIITNKKLALWLLDIPAVQEQIKKDVSKQAFLTVANCIVLASDDNPENFQIEDKLLTIQPLNAKIIANTLKQYLVYGYQTIEHIIKLSSTYEVLNYDQNLVLNTAIDLDLQDVAQKTLDNSLVRYRLKKDLQNYGELSRGSVNSYLEDRGLYCESIDRSWVFHMFVQNTGNARVVAAPQRVLTREEQIEKNHRDYIAQEANMLAAYKRQQEKDRASKQDDVTTKPRLGCSIS